MAIFFIVVGCTTISSVHREVHQIACEVLFLLQSVFKMLFVTISKVLLFYAKEKKILKGH